MKRIDITPHIISHCLSNTELVNLIGDRVSSPGFQLSEGVEEPNPKIAFKQVGDRYAFYVRGGTQKEARKIAFMVTDLFVENVVPFSGVNLLDVVANGSIVDEQLKNDKGFECFFYLTFNFYES